MAIEHVPESQLNQELQIEHELNETTLDDTAQRSNAMIEHIDEVQMKIQGGGPKISVVGVGGAGSNAVDSMGDGALGNIEFLVVNTDIQALERSVTARRLHIGKNATKGLGTGANPVLGEQAANEDRELLRQELEGSDLVFITAGLGGGTGTGASAVIAEVVREIGALSVAIITKPFDFEGSVRRKHAEKGQKILREEVDTLITIPNQRLVTMVDDSTTLIDAFKLSDTALRQCVQSIADLISRPGLINLDFADIKAIMDASGGAVMGVGYGSGENRADTAFEQASCSPLMEEEVIEGAKGILINITCGTDVKLLEIDKAITRHVREKADGDANVIFGVVIDPELRDEMKVTILATGSKQGKKRDINLEQENNHVIDHPIKKIKKTPFPYVKKGLSETVENDQSQENDYGYAKQTQVSNYLESKQQQNSSEQLQPIQSKKPLFGNFKKSG